MQAWTFKNESNASYQWLNWDLKSGPYSLKEGKVATVYAVKVFRRSRVIAPFFLTLAVGEGE
jgi:hypothetical protein